MSATPTSCQPKTGAPSTPHQSFDGHSRLPNPWSTLRIVTAGRGGGNGLFILLTMLFLVPAVVRRNGDLLGSWPYTSGDTRWRAKTAQLGG